METRFPEHFHEAKRYMINEIINRFKDKSICILGFGVEGRSSFDFLRKHLPDANVTICDKSAPFADISGEGYLDNLSNFDVILKSPGISLKDIDISAFRDRITSQVELFLEFAQCKTVGITGTKGKSTTSSLIYSILKEQGVPSFLLGNIGAPIFDHLSEITPKTVVVLELSSHQLEFVKHSPHIALLLNIFPEHLDHYASYNHYAEAKQNIAKFQKSGDFFLNSKNVPPPPKMETKLRGEHNLVNISFALETARLLGLNPERAQQTAKNFVGLPHRMQFVGTYNDIDFYDDAIATIPQATIECVKSLKEVSTLIIGGMDRGVDMNGLVKFLSTGIVPNVICMPSTGLAIADQIKKCNVYSAETLEEAVLIAKKTTPIGGCCVLSPAAASYEFYKNFAEKGNDFQRLVCALNV